jgi:hypothetical protein
MSLEGLGSLQNGQWGIQAEHLENRGVIFLAKRIGHVIIKI